MSYSYIDITKHILCWLPIMYHLQERVIIPFYLPWKALVLYVGDDEKLLEFYLSVDHMEKISIFLFRDIAYDEKLQRRFSVRLRRTCT